MSASTQDGSGQSETVPDDPGEPADRVGDVAPQTTGSPAVPAPVGAAPTGTGLEVAGEINEADVPDETGLGGVFKSQRGGFAPHPDSVRMWLAVGMVVILAGIVTVACAEWASGAGVRRMQALAVVMSPVVTLVGTILGFYFSSSGRSSR